MEILLLKNVDSTLNKKSKFYFLRMDKNENLN